MTQNNINLYVEEIENFCIMAKLRGWTIDTAEDHSRYYRSHDYYFLDGVEFMKFFIRATQTEVILRKKVPKSSAIETIISSSDVKEVLEKALEYI